MIIEIHFYSISKELAGASARRITVPTDSTLTNALDVLFGELPALAPIRESCLYAIGTSYAPLTAPLAEGDVISIIPPMQGG